MNKQLLALLLLVFTFTLPGHAVLKENGLDTTLIMLRTELTNYHVQLERESKDMKAQQQAIGMELFSILNQANQNAIMLYSQRDGYIFDMAYACHEATQQFHNFKSKAMPFRQMVKKVNIQVARYDSLIQNLTMMPTMYMTESAKTNRVVCLALAVNIRRQLVENQQQFNNYIQFYTFTEQRLKSLNDYANKRYTDLQTSIFKNGDHSYFYLLRHFTANAKEAESSVSDKYKLSKNMVSQWDVRIILFLFLLILFYGFISITLNIITIRFFVTYLIKKGKFSGFKEQFFAKRTCIILALTVVTFAIILGVIRATVQQNFLIMASNLLVEYAWLLGVILFSLLFRVQGSQIKSAFHIYTPMIVMGFLVIAFRIILIPNDLVNLVFPPILLLCALWQWYVIHRHGKNVPKDDNLYSWISLSIFILSVITSWSGYTLMSVQILIWWVMQLTCILTITFAGGWLRAYAQSHDFEHKPINRTWFHSLTKDVVLPTCGVLSFLLAIYWAADVFNLSNTTREIFFTHFIDSRNFSVSIVTISIVVVLYFTFRYINSTVKALLKLHFERTDFATAASRNIMATNVLQVVIWGIWLLISLALLHVSNTWLVVVSGGLSTGIGFASKDILENIYYGISLMAGRIKIGDYIVCDGVRGKVSSISYTSTMLEATDGSVIAFQNSQLFTKNYKNMTKNHGYELDILEVGVAYGSNVQQVKQLLIDAIGKLDCIYKKKGVHIVLKSFDDNCITLKILVWVNVLTQYADDGVIMETIYNTLNNNNIEIPFPQREITIKHITNTAEKSHKVDIFDTEDLETSHGHKHQ